MVCRLPLIMRQTLIINLEPDYRSQDWTLLKWHYDENCIFPIKVILKHKQVACMREKMTLTIFKQLFLFQGYSSFQNMQISYDEKGYLSQFVSEMFDSLQWSSIKCSPQYELNSFVTMATYWVRDIPNVKGSSLFYFDIC